MKISENFINIIQYIYSETKIFLRMEKGYTNEYYKTSIDWEGSLYCEITLDWNYEERYLDISMPGYVTKVLQRFQHDKPAKPQ